jgi:hypothetical protein
MRRTLLALMLACGSITSATAQVSVGIGVNLPGVSIGINLPSYPQFVRVPNYPVYYAPGVNGNFFFYDGLYWVYEGDSWYESSWYNGPWVLVEPSYVPLFVLRVPVRYYRAPPVYFRDWQRDAPPRWGDHWGRGWEDQHRGWDRWNRSAAPAPAPLPVYQRQYTGNRYPPVEQQRTLQNQNYRYQPRDAVVRQHFEQSAPPQRPAVAAPPRPDTSARPQRPAPQNAQRADVPAPPRAGAGEARQAAPSPRAREDQQRQAAPVERAPQGRPAPPQAAPHPAPAQREAPAARAPAERGPGPAAPAPQGAGRGQEKGQGQGQGQGQEKDRGRGEGRGPDKKD